MAWIVKNQDESDFFDALKDLPDRIAGLLCATIIEDRLKDAIKVRWHDYNQSDYHLHKMLFGESGIMFNFGTCVQIGYCIGLLSDEAFKDLRYISKIRNAFAHKIEHKDFDHTQINSFSMNLRAPERYPIKKAPAINNPTPMELAGMFLADSSVSDMTLARHRFIRATEIYSGLLMVESLNPVFKKPEPAF